MNIKKGLALLLSLLLCLSLLSACGDKQPENGTESQAALPTLERPEGPAGLSTGGEGTEGSAETHGGSSEPTRPPKGEQDTEAGTSGQEETEAPTQESTGSSGSSGSLIPTPSGGTNPFPPSPTQPAPTQPVPSASEELPPEIDDSGEDLEPEQGIDSGEDLP